jgi:hypothetical protein
VAADGDDLAVPAAQQLEVGIELAGMVAGEQMLAANGIRKSSG